MAATKRVVSDAMDTVERDAKRGAKALEDAAARALPTSATWQMKWRRLLGFMKVSCWGRGRIGRAVWMRLGRRPLLQLLCQAGCEAAGPRLRGARGRICHLLRLGAVSEAFRCPRLEQSGPGFPWPDDRR